MLDLVGQTLGAYNILEIIGGGGMATVYKAYHPATERDVAIKVIHPQFAEGTDFVERFEREAKGLAKLRHTNILPVFDYGQEGEISYLVMPYTPTGTLADYLEKETLSLEEVTRLFCQIAGAVDYAHRQGVIHRDLKPGNVLLDDSHNALLADFGLMRITRMVSNLTQGVIGTPAYIAPEQWQDRPADARSDIYALGIMLYEMLAGELPYEADSMAAMVRKHLYDPVPPLRERCPKLPESVEEVVIKALGKNPDHRFQTAGEMSDALQQSVFGLQGETQLQERTLAFFDLTKLSSVRLRKTIAAILGDDTHAGIGANLQIGKRLRRLRICERLRRLQISERISQLQISERISRLQIGERLRRLQVCERIRQLQIGERLRQSPIVQQLRRLQIGERLRQLQIGERLRRLPIVERLLQSPIVERLRQSPIVQQLRQVMQTNPLFVIVLLAFLILFGCGGAHLLTRSPASGNVPVTPSATYTLTSTATFTPSITPTPTHTPSPTPTPPTTPWYVSTNIRINIRACRSTSCGILGGADPGEILLVIDTQDGWHTVLLPSGYLGYVAADLTDMLPEDEQTPTP